MHYTTASGIAGIVSSGCIWATHAAFLNDAEEMKHFFDSRLPDICLPEVEKFANEKAQSPENTKMIAAQGGLPQFIRLLAETLPAIIRKHTLAFNQPYIFSMCGTRDPLVSHSGLLSQWRGYGSDGGYALVFDTSKFEELLKLEGETFGYQHAVWGDVYYHGVDQVSQPSTEDVAEYEAAVRTGIAKMLEGGKAEEAEGFYEAISSLSCLYKHWGFREEHEVRVVAIPVDAEVARLSAAEGETKQQKPIKTFIRAGVPIPYIELFMPPDSKTSPARLPIKRVIIGPHNQNGLRAQAVQRLLAANGYNDVEVVRSQIPYIGR